MVLLREGESHSREGESMGAGFFVGWFGLFGGVSFGIGGGLGAEFVVFDGRDDGGGL